MEDKAMLVLTRNIDETIFIGEDAKIKIKVLSVSGAQVRLGIETSKEIPVYREEIYKRLSKVDASLKDNIYTNKKTMK